MWYYCIKAGAQENSPVDVAGLKEFSNWKVCVRLKVTLCSHLPEKPQKGHLPKSTLICSRSLLDHPKISSDSSLKNQFVECDA